MYRFMTYEGGVYRANELVEMVEDLGGHIIQTAQVSREIILTLAIPEEDMQIIEKVAMRLRGTLREGALIGTEIGVISPSVSRHHLPHPVCDIAEYLRRMGGVTNIIGMGRGTGRRIAQISMTEKAMIDEYDAAVFIFGNFEDCIMNQKARLLSDLNIPIIVTGGPDIHNIPHADGYVCGIGRRTDRMRKKEDIERLEEIARLLGRCIEDRRREIAEDPLSIDPIEIKQYVDGLPIINQATRHSPTILHLDGLRIKLPYDRYADEIRRTKILGKRLDYFARVTKSRNERGDILIKILPESAIQAESAADFRN